MTAGHDGRTLAAMTYSGEVYNHRELRADLLGRGHRFRTSSDTEVVLRAYLEWGEDFVHRLNGMYAMAIWDTRREQLLLLRDRMGIKPLHYHPTPHGVVFGSEPKAILAHPAIKPEIDADGLRDVLALGRIPEPFARTPERCPYRDVFEVAPGQLVRVRREGLVKHRYWQLTADEHTDDLATTIDTVRGLLTDIVARQLIADVPICTLLSGGLDSSAITALAASLQPGDPVRSFAVDFTGYSEHFRPEPTRDAPDAPYVRDLAEHVGADHTDIVLSNADLIDPGNRSAVLRANDLPHCVGDMYTSLLLLFRAISAHSTVALSGESADEIFGGYAWFHDARATQQDTFPWLAALPGAKPNTEIALLDPALLDRLDIAGYRRSTYREALAEVPHIDDASDHERRLREACYLHLTRFLPILLDRKDRMSMATGLEVRVPFCDHRLVQYLYNVPWALKTFDGREKSLLRAAVQELLPTSILERRKCPYPSTQDPWYEQALRDEFAALLDRPDASIAPLLDIERAHAALARPIGTTSLSWSRRDIEAVLGLNAWLTGHDVRWDSAL